MNRTMEDRIIQVIRQEEGLEWSDMSDGFQNLMERQAKAILSLFKDAGYLHKSEIRFPEEKDKKHIKLGYGELYEVMNAEINGFNQAISETKKLNGVDDEI